MEKRAFLASPLGQQLTAPPAKAPSFGESESPNLRRLDEGDGLTEVTDTSDVPEAYILKLFPTFSSSGMKQCSGGLNNMNTGTSAAHCVYDRDDSEEASSLTICPGF